MNPYVYSSRLADTKYFIKIGLLHLENKAW